MSKQHSMFMRFYNQPREKIDECIQKLMVHNPKIKKIDYVKATGTVNLGMEPTQIEVFFKNATDLQAAHTDENMRSIYKAYCTGGGLGGRFVARSPGDPTFGTFAAKAKI